MGPVGAAGPWVGMVEEHQFRSRAMPEDAVDARDFRSGFAEAADPPAIAAVGGRTHRSAPTSHPGGLGGEAGQRGMGGSKSLRDHLHCSEDTPREDIQHPLDSVDQDSDDAGVESEAAQRARCPAPLDSPG